MRKEKGITLVALVITVIIIIILATVTINMAFGDNGLITQAQRAKDMTSNSVVAEQEGMNSVLSEYLNVMGEDSEIIPPIKEEPPIITNISTSDITANSIKVTVTATAGTSEITSYTYSITGQEPVTVADASYTFTGLNPSTQYTIQVTVTDKAGKTATQSTQATTEQTTVADAIENGTEFGSTTEIKDASGDSVWIPGGFEIASDSATDADDGIVITNSDNSKQFVWIPVDETSLNEMYQTSSGINLTGVTTTTNVYSKLRQGTSSTGGAPGSTTYREPDLVTDYDTDSSYTNIIGYANAKAMADAIVAEYTATYNSIQKYKGFYIGRYELTGSVSSPTVQKGQTVRTNQNWYNLKKACSNVVTGAEYEAQSTMIYGNQWDEVMDWIVDTGEKSSSEVNTNSASWGNYSNSSGNAATGSGTKRSSGYNEVWKANNIYDLAGNCWEWTQEAYGISGRTYRGGSYENSGSDGSSSERYRTDPYHNSSNRSSRPVLYIK